MKSSVTVTLTLLALTMSFVRTVAAQPLPEGNAGIASRHPGDVGIEADPDVVFAEDFEGVTGRLDFSDRWNNVWGNLAITTAPEHVHAGMRAIEVTATEPERSQGASHELAGHDTVFVRYYMKYHPEFPGMHHTGIDLFAGAPGIGQGESTGVRPNGTDSFQALLDTLSPMFGWSPPDNRPPGMLEVYCYHMDQSDVYGDVFFSTGEGRTNRDVFGSEFVPRDNFIPERGRYYSFELMVKANTPGSDDGRVAFWVDGVLTGDFPSIRFRTVDTLRINQAIITTYVSELAPNQTVWYDDIVVALSYIGPMASEGVPGVDASLPRTDGGAGSTGDGGSSGGGGGARDGGGDPGGGGTGADGEGCGCSTIAPNGRRGTIALVLATLFVLARRRPGSSRRARAGRA